MTDLESSRPINTPILQNHSLHLPNNVQKKKQLKEEIEAYIKSLQEGEGNQAKIDTLNLRKKLIDSHGLSIQRIDNLEVIFLHYCSHIFKTGKHMTFERLQYQKSHLTMDRFFVFLKDFALTVAKIDGNNKEVIDKNDIVLLFKKVSVNAKDLNFEQFISCLEKIGLLYYDSMLNYHLKQQKLADQRKKRKLNYMKSLKRRKAALQAAKKGQNIENQLLISERPGTNENRKTQQEEEEEVQPADNQQHENDKLIDSIMNDKDIENPNEQVLAEMQKLEGEENQNEQQTNKEHNQISSNRQYLLQLTPEEKIEYFYQLINVDNAAAFKRKMRELNLPLFQTKHHRNYSYAHKISESIKDPRPEETLREKTQENDEQKRLQDLRTKIEQRKERDKGNTPYISKQDYQQRKKKREKEEIEATVVVRTKDPKKKKIDLNDLQIDLSSLSNMAHENINFHRFNPQKLIQPSEEEDPYLQEYTSNKRTQRSEKRILSNYESNDGRSQVMLEKLKKRAQEIEVRERNAESKYASSTEALTSIDHQIRKNRLVEKLMKIYKQ